MPAPKKLPAPPRTPRRRAVLRRRWVVGVIGATLLFTVSVVGVVVLAAGGDLLPLADDALDASHSIAEGEVVAVGTGRIHAGDSTLFRIDYRFRPKEGDLIDGHSFSPPRPGLSVGAVVRIEYLPDAPEVSRLRGSVRNPLGPIWNILLGAVAMPGGLMTLWWLRGVMRLRLMLATGRSTTAEIVERRAAPGVNPPQARVSFRFADARGQEHESAHWVGRRSALGRDLESGAHAASVIYDEGDPSICRLAHPDDFVS